VERGEEIPRGLIVARSDAAELLEFTKEILDQAACLVERFVERAGCCYVFPRGITVDFPALARGLRTRSSASYALSAIKT
jgi:hypothetical protein